MAKARRNLSQLRKNNKVGVLICHAKDCDNEFFVATFKSGVSHRLCKECRKPSKREKDLLLLKSLGFV